jgi:hypothetical protein
MYVVLVVYYRPPLRVNISVGRLLITYVHLRGAPSKPIRFLDTYT